MSESVIRKYELLLLFQSTDNNITGPISRTGGAPQSTQSPSYKIKQN